jgi:LysM repeat protein
MKFVRGLFLLVAAGLIAGCDTFYQDARYADSNRQEAVRIEMVRQQQARDLDVMKARNEALEYHLQQADARLDRIEGALREAGTPQADIAALRRDIEQLRAGQATLRQEIVDELGREIVKLFAAQQTSARGGTRRTGAQTGYEHKVQAGQTLSEIAAAYQVSVATIKQANNLKDDVIRVGQVLFIPD